MLTIHEIIEEIELSKRMIERTKKDIQVYEITRPHFLGIAHEKLERYENDLRCLEARLATRQAIYQNPQVQKASAVDAARQFIRDFEATTAKVWINPWKPTYGMITWKKS